ncbi:MAG: hypothetical protein OXN18_08955 [Gemmatimonadota bacterium]|nr:hypothetical protein [Gemmatimonadota bacterium]
MATSAPPRATYRVIDAYNHPHGGRILRLRLGKGEALRVKELKSCVMTARAPDGREERISVDGFALFGGRPSDSRLARTGRVDVHTTDEAARLVDVGWTLAGPA